MNQQPYTPTGNISQHPYTPSSSTMNQQMYTPNGSMAPPASTPTASGERPKLSEAQKKANHKASEEKRRDQIRAGFIRISDSVPGCKGRGKSEALVLRETVKELRRQAALKETLKRKMMETMSEHEVEKWYAEAEKAAQLASRAKSQGTPIQATRGQSVGAVKYEDEL